MMLTRYSLDLYYLDNGYHDGPICHLDDISFDGDVRDMLCSTFPQFPKSQWSCWWFGKPDNRGHADVNGLYIRVHYHQRKSQGEWDYWRMWKPWKAWLYIEGYNEAVKFAKKFKKDYDARKLVARW